MTLGNQAYTLEQNCETTFNEINPTLNSTKYFQGVVSYCVS